jgi:hypothetical protein
MEAFRRDRRHRTVTESTRRKVNSDRKACTICASYWTSGKDAPMLSDLDGTGLAAERAVDFYSLTMLASRSAAITIALLMISAPGVAQSQSRPRVAPEHQDMVEKRAKEREKIDGCQRQATEQNILPRDRPQFVIKCLDGLPGRRRPRSLRRNIRSWRQNRRRKKSESTIARDRRRNKKSCRAIVRNSSSTAWKNRHGRAAAKVLLIAARKRESRKHALPSRVEAAQGVAVAQNDPPRRRQRDGRLRLQLGQGA